MYRYFYLTTVLCVSTLTVGCDNTSDATEQAGVFYISHNKTEPLEFKIDNTHFMINKGEVKKIILNNGKHVFIDANGKKSIFMVYPGNHGGIINPNREIYYSFTTVFTPEGNRQNIHLDRRPVWIAGRLISGAINSSDALFIDNNVFRCDIALNESLPEYWPDWKNTNKVDVLTKCFSQDEFNQFLSQYPYGIHFYSEHDLLTEYSANEKFSWIDNDNTRTDDCMPAVHLIKFKSDKLLIEANIIHNIINHYLASRNPDEKKDFYNKYHEHIMKMASIYSQEIQNDIFDDRDAYFQFIKETGRIFGAGVLSEPVLM